MLRVHVCEPCRQSSTGSHSAIVVLGWSKSRRLAPMRNTHRRRLLIFVAAAIAGNARRILGAATTSRTPYVYTFDQTAFLRSSPTHDKQGHHVPPFKSGIIRFGFSSKPLNNLTAAVVHSKSICRFSIFQYPMLRSGRAAVRVMTNRCGQEPSRLITRTT